MDDDQVPRPAPPRSPSRWPRPLAPLEKFAAKLRELSAAVGFQLVSIVSMAVIFPITTQALEPSGYGEYTTLYVIAGFAISFVYASGSAAIVQLVLQRRRTTLSVHHRGRIQVMVLAAPFAVIGSLASIVLFGPQIALAAVIVFGSDLILAGLAEVNLAVIFAVRGVSRATAIRLVLPVLRAAGTVALAVTGSVTIVNLVIVNSLATVVMLVASTLAVRRELAAAREAGSARASSDPARPTTPDGAVEAHDGASDPDPREDTTGRELARLTGVYVASISANTTQDQGERLVLASLRPRAELGEYAAAYRLVDLVLLPLSALNVVATRWVLPETSRRGVHVDRARRMSIPVAAYCLVAGAVVVLARPVVRLIIGEEFDLALEMVVWLSGFPLLRALADIPAIGLIGLGRNAARMWLGISGAVFALASYLVLIPWIEWRGAVVGTYLSEAATLIGGWILLMRFQARADREDDAAGQPASGSAETVT
ncbi:lipopolysaccharide biosynthesis protein [Ilumatobacter sp.]|uniref:lipopolysaccharide biosynthesis protein n=1 Tax=Ilumatobacter sp. TaxID=1967498 RepID=UPI003B52E18E